MVNINVGELLSDVEIDYINGYCKSNKKQYRKAFKECESYILFEHHNCYFDITGVYKDWYKMESYLKMNICFVCKKGVGLFVIYYHPWCTMPNNNILTVDRHIYEEGDLPPYRWSYIQEDKDKDILYFNRVNLEIYPEHNNQKCIFIPLTRRTNDETGLLYIMKTYGIFNNSSTATIHDHELMDNKITQTINTYEPLNKNSIHANNLKHNPKQNQNKIKQWMISFPRDLTEENRNIYEINKDTFHIIMQNMSKYDELNLHKTCIP